MTNIREIVNSSLSMTSQKNYDKVETGFKSIDSILSGGLGKGELDVIAAAPAVGKSAFALNILVNECENLIYAPANPNQKPPMVYYVSIEMNGAEIFERLVSFKAGKSFKLKDYHGKKYSTQDSELFTIAIDTIAKYPLITNQTFHASIDGIAGQMSQLASSHDLKLVVIDHLHIMDYDRNKENNAIADITKRLKSLAKEHNVPILLLSQVNKTKEAFGYSSKFKSQPQQATNTSDQDPNAIGMHDLRGSGAIGQDASVIILM
jgi:replicative DNA helicase